LKNGSRQITAVLREKWLAWAYLPTDHFKHFN